MVKGGAEFKQTWKYLYDDDGQLESASIVDNTQCSGDFPTLITIFRVS